MERAEKIAWHPAFYGGIELELRQWKADLIFETEHELSREPLLMDMLIIKKIRNVHIDKPFGEIFRMYNVVEFKSPEDTLSIDGFFKTLGYACLYKGMGKTTNEIPGEELTVSMFCCRHPKGLFACLEQMGVPFRRRGGGLYDVEILTSIPVQVVVTGELDPEGANALRLFKKRVGEAELRDFLMQAFTLTEPGDSGNASAVLHAVVAANSVEFEKIRRGLSMTQEQILSALFGDLIAKSRAEGREEGRKEGREEGREEGWIDIVMNMLRASLPVNVIMQCSNFSAEKVEEIARSIGVPVTR